MKGRVAEYDIEFLRGCTETVVRELFGVTDPSRPMRCPNPDHDDSDPSAHFYVKDGLVHCFGCDGTWDVFALVGMVFGISGFREQVEKVAEIVGYRLSGSDDGPKPRPRRKVKARPPFDEPKPAGGKSCYEAIGCAFGDLYAPGNEVGRRWLRHRCLDDGDAARYALGFTRDPRAIMPEFKVYEPEALGYITIPFFTDSTCGEANYCMLRTISRGKVRCKEWRPAGIASPLWNEWMLNTGVDEVFVTEGLLDAMSVNKLLVGANVMALGGTSNAKRFSQVLYRAPAELRPKKVVVCMDEDEAGHKTRDRLIADLDRMGIWHATMPAYPKGCKDANDLLALMRGREWDFEERDGGPLGTMYYTRWR